MSAYINKFNDVNGDIVYPESKVKAVYNNGELLSETLNKKINKDDVYTKEEIRKKLTVSETEEI